MNHEKDEENKENLDRVLGKPTDTQRQTLIESYDARSSTHINAVIAIVFGSFALLAILKGVGLRLENIPIWYLLGIEMIGFPLCILYCLSKSWLYSNMAQQIRGQDLRKMERMARNKALGQIPTLVRPIIAIRTSASKAGVLGIVGVFWILWILVVLAVLSL